MTATLLSQAHTALKRYFGYETFRPMQADIIQAIFEKKDSLVLMPTGGGKSICFQIPAVVLEGTCVVVSPLISLMKDQVEALRVNGIKASFLNSSLMGGEQQAVEEELFQGRLQLLYVSPEKMVSQSFLPLLKRCNVNLIAIDEAHCISAWGHDFRPEYTQLSFLKREFPNTPIVALTATADKITRRDIAEQLQLSDPQTFLASFDRPNLSLTVKSGQRRIEQIVDFIKQRPNQSGIVYCLSRKSTEELADKLRRHGIPAKHYHAMLPAKERSDVQEDFINDRTPIICATVAFGMGIDKSNVRWVIHYNLPKNLEGYYQEIGRAGRDGVKADTVLFYSLADVNVLRDFIRSSDNKEMSEMQLAKLDRMLQYADSLMCRRKMLLNYFGETLEKDCGNCDVCKNPPVQINGTVIAQKALSAVARLQENVGMGLLIDVLRGSSRQEILEKGYDKIKTYGAGRDISLSDWQQYVLQLINSGYLEVAYDQKHVLKLTPASKAVLFEGAPVQLVQPAVVKSRIEERKVEAKAQSEGKGEKMRVRDELFDVLRKLRADLAKRDGVPPYVVFSDATLEEMAAKRPITDEDMLHISGVGEQKLRRYGSEFIAAISDFIRQKLSEGAKIQGSTYLVTYDLYKQGLSIAEIAQKRELGEITIYSHLASLYEKGEMIDLSKYVSREEMIRIIGILPMVSEPYQLKEIFEALSEELDYHKIRLTLAYINREELKRRRDVGNMN